MKTVIQKELKFETVVFVLKLEKLKIYLIILFASLFVSLFLGGVI